MTHAERATRRAAMAGEASDGEPVAEVARRYGVTAYTVRNACRAHGVRIGDAPRPPSSATLGIVADFINTDASLYSIAMKHSRSLAYVCRLYASVGRSGIRTPPRPNSARDRQESA